MIQTILVSDDTPPEGDAVTYHTSVNEATPTKSSVDAFMKNAGEYEVKVNLFDEAGNKSTITSKLIVYEEALKQQK